MNTEQIDKCIGLIREFIPTHIDVENPKQLAMYNLFHELEALKESAATPPDMERLAKTILERIEVLQDIQQSDGGKIGIGEKAFINCIVQVVTEWQAGQKQIAQILSTCTDPNCQWCRGTGVIISKSETTMQVSKHRCYNGTMDGMPFETINYPESLKYFNQAGQSAVKGATPREWKPSQLIPLPSSWLSEFKKGFYKDNTGTKKEIDEAWAVHERCAHMIYKYQVEEKRRQISAQQGSQDATPGSEGARLIAQERTRQISKEGWTPEHDAEHTHGELAIAAACYALHHTDSSVHNPNVIGIRPWPWDDMWWKPADAIKNLTRAGALIAAEIDRLKNKNNG